MKWAMSEKFKDYLWGAKVLVITDNNPLVHLRTAKLGAVEQRWVAQLANYDYQLQYRLGREHTNADVLSRLPEAEGRGALHWGLLLGAMRGSWWESWKHLGSSKRKPPLVGAGTRSGGRNGRRETLG